MAIAYINGVLHETTKDRTNRLRCTCDKCGKVYLIAWVVSVVIAHSPHLKPKARYCYDCTSNHWARAFRLYRESVAPNAEVSGLPPPGTDKGA